MSLSLYRKYRPETFTDVVGQEHIETTLKNAVQTDNVSHAYLFCGPRGTGKTTTARLLAKALLCENAPTDHPDGTCEQCLAIANGIHPDVYELDAASRTGVENVREEIIGRVQFAPTRGSYKIYIIDEVHMLSTAAFNALLKTLEEPPSHVVFVLCTTDPHKVPETIQSRCQRFDFHRLSEEEISARLVTISESEGFTLESEAISLIAQRSQGGMRDAISALEQVAIFGGGTVSFAAAESMLGEVSAEQLFSVSSLIASRDVASCFAWVASFTQSGTDIAQFVRDLAGHVRNVYVASVLGNDPTLAEILGTDAEQIGRYLTQAAEFGSPDRLANILVTLGDLSTQLRSAANARLALEIALTRMARPQSDLTLESLAARLDILEAGAIPIANSDGTEKARPLDIPVSSGLPTPLPPTSTEPLATGSAPRLWTQLIKELVAAKKRSIATMLGGSTAHLDPKTEGLLIELPTDASFNKQQLERSENEELLRGFVVQVFGSDLPLTFILGAPSTPASGAPGKPENKTGDGSLSYPAPSSPSSVIPSTTKHSAAHQSAYPLENLPANVSAATEVAVPPSESASTSEQQRDLADDAVPQMSLEDILAASFGAPVLVNEVPPRP